MTIDLEFEQIHQELSTPLDRTPGGLSRRRFLQMTAVGGAIATVGPTLGRYEALAGPQLGSGEGVLVMIQLGGGNDGVNTVIPANQPAYQDLRGSLAIDEGEMLHLGNGLALHPSLSNLRARWDSGQVAIIQGIGYQEPSLSHFDSMAHWMHGKAGSSPDEAPKDGWLGRWLDGLGSTRSDLEAVVFGSSVPLHLRGRSATATGLSTHGIDFGIKTDDDHQRMYDAIREMAEGDSPHGLWADAVAQTSVGSLDLAKQLSSAYEGQDNGGSDFERQMARSARLINADVGVRILNTSLGGFDNHTNQSSTHAGQLANLDSGIQRFFSTLDPQFASRVTVMTFSEFGRRPETNGSAGTDHGTASVALVIGANVSGGLVGNYPSLTDLDSRQNLKPVVDFRSMYATVLDSWLGADSNEVLGGEFEALPLFMAGPGNSTFERPAPVPGSRQGYLMVTDAGGVYNFGNKPAFGGSIGGDTAGIDLLASGTGYWLCRQDGAVEAFGDAKFHGSMVGKALAAPLVDMASHPSGDGYWLLGADGGVFSFGKAPFYGSTGNLRLRQPVVGMAAHPTGKGYWFVASDGGVFAYGRAAFHGSTGHLTLRRPVVGIAPTPTGKGYWLVADDGGVFAFGDAGFHGSTGALTLARPIVSIAPTPTGRGYWLAGDDGGVFAFGDAGFHGSLGDRTVPGRVISVAG
ncbi:MAG: DUF1501 domain-containing protein [Actinomycetia bacterium]|nr:DUF1501 domain-containing protein [Actinomycetes bacterium]MCP4959893.1 DUF1501 domain-containing protein [Actinomycetes bacterium]